MLGAGDDDRADRERRPERYPREQEAAENRDGPRCDTARPVHVRLLQRLLRARPQLALQRLGDCLNRAVLHGLRERQVRVPPEDLRGDHHVLNLHAVVADEPPSEVVE